MAEIIPVQQLVYDKDRFSKVINTQFSELNPQEVVAPEITVEEFFVLYEELFFDIPREGDINSHRYILQKEAEYLGVQFADDVDIQALLQEITDLRQQLLAAETQNVRLSDQLPLSTLDDLENQELLQETLFEGEQLLSEDTLDARQEALDDLAALQQPISDEVVVNTQTTSTAQSSGISPLRQLFLNRTRRV
jgi:hypothetical protein